MPEPAVSWDSHTLISTTGAGAATPALAHVSLQPCPLCRAAQDAAAAHIQAEVRTVTVQPRQQGAVAAQVGGAALTTPHTAAEYFLQKRSFAGVETPATGAPVKVAEAAATGRRGRAAVYDTEVTR